MDKETMDWLIDFITIEKLRKISKRVRGPISTFNLIERWKDRETEKGFAAKKTVKEIAAEVGVCLRTVQRQSEANRQLRIKKNKMTR